MHPKRLRDQLVLLLNTYTPLSESLISTIVFSAPPPITILLLVIVLSLSKPRFNTKFITDVSNVCLSECFVNSRIVSCTKINL